MESPIQLAEELASLRSAIKKRHIINPLEWFSPLPFQERFKRCLSKIKGIFGGNRSGKTEEGAEYVLSRGLDRKLRIWCCSETEEVSINVQQRKMWELLPKNQIKYGHYDEINGFRNGKLTLKNGTIYRFKTYKQGREAFASDDIDIIWNDEEPPYDIYVEQKMRLIDRDGEMIFTMTSLKGITEVISELFEDHEVVESKFAPLVNETLPRVCQKNSATFFMLWTTENTFINQPRLLEDVKVMARLEIKSRIYGIPVNLSGRIYPQFSKKVHIVGQDRVPKRLVTLYHILDPHDRKPWAMIWIAVDKTDTAYVIREYPWKQNFNEMEFDDKTYDDYAEVIRNTEAELLEIYGRQVYRRIIDPNFGNKTVQLAKRVNGKANTTPIKELRARGFKFDDGIDALEAGHIQMRKFLHWQEKDGEIIVQPKILFLDDCSNSITHHVRYSWKDIETSDGDVKAKPQLMQKYKDFCDLTRYAAMCGLRYVEIKAKPIIEAEKVY